MANICDFCMIVKGKKENIEQFINMMEQKGNVYMGRGAVINFTDIEEVDNGKYRCQIDGYTKWSIQSSMIDATISMIKEPDKWNFGENVDVTKLSFVTLFEACEQLELDMEVYSEECGCCFQEHYLFVDGEVIENECVEYIEEYNEETGEYESTKYIKNKEEAILKKWLNDIGYKEPIGYYRNVLTNTMKIYASKIGWLVGVEGVNVSKLKKMLSEEFYGKWNVEFIEVRGGFINV